MPSNRFTSLMARLVPPRREFIFRSDGHVRYVGIGRFGQITIILAVALFVGWVGFASSGYFSNTLMVAERNVRIATSDRVIRNMQAEIEKLEQELAAHAHSIDERTAEKNKIVHQNTELRDQIDSLEQERERLQKIRHERDLDVARLNDELAENIDGRESLEQRLTDAARRHQADQREREQLALTLANSNKEVIRLTSQIGRMSREQTRLAGELNLARTALETSVAERARDIAERGEMIDRIALLSDRLEQFEESQSESIARLGENADQGISVLERTLEVAGLDVPLMLERVLGENGGGADGVGGPFLALADEPGSEAGEQLALVEQRLSKLQGLQDLMKHLPLAAPMDEVRMTSGFGRRRDPFTNRLAMHPGLDFASRHRRPAFVTAPGTVAFVGWKGGYGKVVEVDHGLGIRTRFAHLSRIFVKRGQQLEFREKVGLIGSTGRSTSTHLHYEIMVDGQQLDPANFIRAGQYVFKN